MKATFYKGEDITLSFGSKDSLAGYTTKAVKYFTFGSAVKTATVTVLDNYRFTAKLAAADTSDLKAGALNIVLELSNAGGKLISKTIEAKLYDAYVDGGEREANEYDADVVFVQGQEIEVNFSVTPEHLLAQINDATAAAQEATELALDAAETVNETVLSAGELGAIAHNAAAPTPGRTGNYVFSSGGVCSWIIGSPMVKPSDRVVVRFTEPSTYTYTHIVNAGTLSDSLTDGGSGIGASSEAVKKLNERIRVVSTTVSYDINNNLYTTGIARANYPVSNWIFVPNAAQANRDGVLKSISLRLTNAQVGRTVQVMIFSKSGLNFTVKQISSALPAESSGVNTLSVELPISTNDFYGVKIYTPNTSNGISFLDTGGVAYPNYGGNGGVVSASQNIGDTITINVETQTRGFDFIGVVEYENVEIDAPTIQEFQDVQESVNEVISDVNQMAEAINTEITPSSNSTPILINEIAVHGNRANYPVRGIYIPKRNTTVRGLLFQLSVNLTNSEAGRTVEFFVLAKTATNSFSIIYKTDSLPAESAGLFSYNITSNIKIESGQYIGCRVNCVNTANSISFIDTGGPIYDYYGGWLYNSSSSITIGDTISANTESNGRGFDIKGVIIPELFLKTLWRNVANGYVGLDVNNKIPNTVSKDSDWWAGKKILWLGTSIPAGSGGGYLSYPEYVAKILNCTVDNQAVGSSGMIWTGSRALTLSATKAELIAAFGAGYEAQSYENKVIGKGVDLIVFDHGYNDRNEATGGNLGTIDSVNRATFYGAFNYVIQAAFTDNPNVKIAFVTPPNRFDYASASQTIAGIDNVRNALKALADKYNAPLYDLSVLSNINGINYTQYKSDGVHPKDSDRPRLGSLIAKFISTIS